MTDEDKTWKSFLEPLSEIDKLRLNAAAINRRSCDDNAKQLEIDKWKLLVRFIELETDDDLYNLLSETLTKYLLGKDPFPCITEGLKNKRGRTKLEINVVEVFYLLNETKSINKTADLMGVDRKTIKNVVHDKDYLEEIKGSGDQIITGMYKKVFGKEYKEFSFKWKDKLGGI